MARSCFALSPSTRADHHPVLKLVLTCFKTAHFIFGFGERWRMMYLQLAEIGPKSKEYWEAWPSSGALVFALLFWASPDKPFHIARWCARKHDGYAQRANAQEA